MGRHEVVNLRQNRPGQHPGVRIRFEESPHLVVVAIAPVEEREHRPRVRDDHRFLAESREQLFRPLAQVGPPAARGADAAWHARRVVANDVLGDGFAHE